MTANRLVMIALLTVLAGWPGQAAALGPGDAAAGFTLPDARGGPDVVLSAFEGKVVYLDFWASWCGPCRKSLPLYEGLKSRLPEGKVAIIAINLDEDKADALAFLAEYPVSYTVALDPAGTVAAQWQVPAMPSSFLIGPDQRILQAWAGFRTSHLEDIEHEIRSAITP